MSPSALTLICQSHYERLLSHASAEPDFAFIGSVGGSSGRGSRSGFSARAVEIKKLDYPDADTGSIGELAASMEAQISRYCLTPGAAEKNYLLGGWLGLISYEFGYIKERRLANSCTGTAVPLLYAGFYLWTATHDHTTNTYYLWVHPECPTVTRELLALWQATEPSGTDKLWQMPAPFLPTQTPGAYRKGVQAVLDYIVAGDCYQANLSQEFSGTYSGEPWLAFKALAQANPTPYSAFLRIGKASVLSVSPERFLRIDGRTITTSPIKGTRPRGATPEQDTAYAIELQESEKDRAENLMIVDLLRNDLGVNAVTGSVTVDKLFVLESYRNVHHLVSHIHAELAKGVTPMKALFDAFPGGSITGAPKLRAMEIIRELEPHWRGPYCGSVFYRGLDGTLDSNIAIRTLLCDGDDTIRCWGGGGIVADSNPESEYQETLTKVQSLMAFLEGYRK